MYKMDERSGYGVMRWTDGSSYHGLWENGIQNGIGVATYENNLLRAGFFEKNVFKRPILSMQDIEPFK